MYFFRPVIATLFFLLTLVVPTTALASGTYAVIQGGSKTVSWSVTGATQCQGTTPDYPNISDGVYTFWSAYHAGTGSQAGTFNAPGGLYTFICSAPNATSPTAQDTAYLGVVAPPTGMTTTCDSSDVIHVSATGYSALSGAYYPIRINDLSDSDGSGMSAVVNGSCTTTSAPYNDLCKDIISSPSYPTYQGIAGHQYKIWIHTLWNGTWSNPNYNGTDVTPITCPVPSLTITASAGTGGSISPSGSVSVAQGGSQSFTITANSGYVISSVTVDGVSQGAISTYTFSNVTANHTISASFVSAVTCPANQTLTWSSCSGTTVSTAAPGSATISNTATGYSGSATFSCNSNGTWNTTPTSSTCNAVYTIQSSAGTGGKISPSGTSQVTSGGSKSYSITANSGYTISDVAVDGVSQGAIASYTFSNVTTNHTISASFTASASGSSVSVNTTTCTITTAGAGVSSCSVLLTWALGTTGYGVQRHNGSDGTATGWVSTASTGNNVQVGQTLLFPKTYFTVEDSSNTVLATSQTVTVSCGSGLSWNSTTNTCQSTATTGCANNKDASGVALTLSAGTYTQTSPSGEYKNTNTTSNSGGNYCWSNSGANTYFVPQNTAAEFNSFWTALQSGTLTGLSIIN